MARGLVRGLSRGAVPAVVAALVAWSVAGCGGLPAAVGPAGIDQLTIPTPSPDPADFAAPVANPWFPLAPGTRWTYRQTLATAARTLVVSVVARHRSIAGISTTAVRWQVRRLGRDRTLLVRWYADDHAGNVWWFGQRVAASGPAVDPLAPRSWEAGRAGAEAGLVLSAAPRVGDGYLNASRPRVVARRSTVESVTGSVGTPRRTYPRAVVTRDLSSLAPLHVVTSYFVRGVGLVAQEDTHASSSGLVLQRVHPGLPRLAAPG